MGMVALKVAEVVAEVVFLPMVQLNHGVVKVF
jgi:hypothetical protein